MTCLFCNACRAHLPKHSHGTTKTNNDFGKGSDWVKKFLDPHYQSQMFDLPMVSWMTGILNVFGLSCELKM